MQRFIHGTNEMAKQLQRMAGDLGASATFAGMATQDPAAVAITGGSGQFTSFGVGTTATQQGAIGDASESHACADFNDVNNALNAIGATLNSVLGVLRAFGLIAT